MYVHIPLSIYKSIKYKDNLPGAVIRNVFCIFIFFLLRKRKEIVNARVISVRKKSLESFHFSPVLVKDSPSFSEQQV